jgi:F-type H+-transporting ATPase subunit b
MKLFFLLTIISFKSFAAGGGHGSVSDLMWPAINFSILFGFLFYKLKTPISNGYKNLSAEFKAKFNSAKIAEQNANIFLEEQKLAVTNASSLLSRMEKEHEVNLNNQAKVIESEYDQKTKKLYADFENKLLGERKKVESQISSNLLESIIKKTSSVISGNPENKNKAMRKFLQ